MTDRELTRLLTIAHEATKDVAHNVDAAQLFTDAARAAERLPGPLGTAVADVLALAAYERRPTGLRGNLGTPKTMTALALAVLAWMPDGATS